MSINLGQVAGAIASTTPPANTKVIWVEVDGGGNTVNLWRYDGGTAQWVVIEGEMQYNQNDW